MQAQQTIRLIKPYSMHPKGTVLTVDASIASLIIQSGRAEAVILPITGNVVEPDPGKDKARIPRPKGHKSKKK
jgi:hypothetical protein